MTAALHDHQATPNVAELGSRIAAGLSRAIEGKPESIELGLIALFAAGHLLIEDVPGVGKTTMAKALARCIDGTVRRIQFTPDLMPADVTGVSVLNSTTGSFDFKPGPVFANIVIGDEINRASPKTQSALLECMEERQVTVDGHSYQLEEPFLVVATQNPADMGGTYPLPEAQRDRFMVRVSMGYPSRAAEIAMLAEHLAIDPLRTLQPVCTASTVAEAIETVRAVHVADSLKAYTVDIVTATRRMPEIRLGASPRAALQLLQAAKARAALRGRDHVLPDDIQSLGIPVLAHRILLAGAGHGAGREAEVLNGILHRVAIPTHPVAPSPDSPPQRGDLAQRAVTIH